MPYIFRKKPHLIFNDLHKPYFCIYIRYEHPYACRFPCPAVCESAHLPTYSPAKTNRLALFGANMLLTNINNCFLDF